MIINIVDTEDAPETVDLFYAYYIDGDLRHISRRYDTPDLLTAIFPESKIEYEWDQYSRDSFQILLKIDGEFIDMENATGLISDQELLQSLLPEEEVIFNFFTLDNDDWKKLGNFFPDNFEDFNFED